MLANYVAVIANYLQINFNMPTTDAYSIVIGDQDQDGVEDAVNICPDTPFGIPVDSYRRSFFINI